MNKGGQFYLIAAIIIVVIVAGFASIANYSKQSDSKKLQDIRDELRIESERVLDYAEASGDDSKIEDFITNFSDYVGGDVDIYYITGKIGGLYIGKYNNGIKDSTPVVSEIGANSINITVESNKYEFDLKEGKNFYFVLSQDIDGERYILTG